MNHTTHMRTAIAEAKRAAAMDEVPVGAVIVRYPAGAGADGEIISCAHNLRETSKNALHHAEIIAINEACEKLGSWRLLDCVLYVTLEPCPMCAGAIVNARIPKVVFGAKDPAAGAFGSMLNLNSYPLYHRPEIVSGVCGVECADILRDYFIMKRSKPRYAKKKQSDFDKGDE